MPRIVMFGLLPAFIFLTAACDRIHEPWIQGENQLVQERARSQAAQQELRYRFRQVQTDR